MRIRHKDLRLGGTAVNKLPIGLHVKNTKIECRFEAYLATFGMLSYHQSIYN